jgi:2'-hydroxyisoflavone reductase
MTGIVPSGPQPSTHKAQRSQELCGELEVEIVTSRTKRIVVLGGTKFLGRAVVESALADGHEVTLFNRGQTNPELFFGLEKIRGDRNGDLSALRGRRWDAVIDVAAHEPEVAHRSAEVLAQAVDRYVFVSTVSVYASHATVAAQLEDAPVLEISDSTDPGEIYGARKAAGERAVAAQLGDRLTVARPGLIVGQYDPTDRFAYWPRRMATGGLVLAPGTAHDLVQFIDVRDLGDWLVHAAVDEISGVFNLVGQPLSFAKLIDACQLPGVTSEVVWVDSETLIGWGVEQWMGLPLWIAEAGWEAANEVDGSRAVESGLRFRPLADTVADARAHGQQPGDRTLTLEHEAELVARFLKG